MGSPDRQGGELSGRFLKKRRFGNGAASEAGYNQRVVLLKIKTP
jgi:hypothetical protein